MWAAGEKSEAKRDKLGCLWGAKRHEKNGCAAVGGKKGRVAPRNKLLRSGWEKNRGVKRRGSSDLEAGQTVLCLGRKRYDKNGSPAAAEKMWGANPCKKRQCSSRGENVARSATKKTANARLGKKGPRIAASPGKFFQLCRGKKLLCSNSRNRYLIPDRNTS